jgi:hypothetical protein
VTLTGLSLLRALNLSFAIASSPIRFEHEITIHDHPHRKSRSNGQRRLNVEIAPHHLLTGLIE